MQTLWIKPLSTLRRWRTARRSAPRAASLSTLSDYLLDDISVYRHADLDLVIAERLRRRLGA